MALFREQADVSVRPAVAEDDVAVASVQLTTWAATHAHTLGPDVLASLDPEAFRERWSAAITAPPTGLHRVLVACQGATVVGFAAIAPAGDEPGASVGELLALEVRPDHQRGGHGSRLLAAAVDHFRSVDMDQVVAWVLDGDTAREQFLTAAGFGSDGAWRELATGPRTVREHQWSAGL